MFDDDAFKFTVSTKQPTIIYTKHKLVLRLSYKLIYWFQTGTVSTFSTWVWPTATHSQIKGLCTWPQGRAATISSTSTCPAALRSAGILLSVWYIVNPVTPLSLHVSPLVPGFTLVTVCTQSERMNEDLKERGRVRRRLWPSGAEGWVYKTLAHLLIMCMLHNMTHMHCNIKPTFLGECALVWFQMYGFT